jgi:hypothetical protein
MRTNTRLWIIILVVALISTTVYSQTRRGYRRSPFILQDGLTITPKVGLNVFYGDLVDKSRASYSVGVTLDREMSKFLSARVQFMGGAMQGTQLNDQKLAYATFENFYVEATIGGTYRPLNQLLGYFKERTIQPYVLFQTGAVYYNATEYWGKASGNPVGSEWRSPSGVAFLTGLGGGTSVWITPNITGNVEFSGNLVFSDKLDGHDVWYSGGAEQIVHTTDPYDFYYTFTVGLTYQFGDSKWRNDPRYNRKTYQKTRKFFQQKTQKRKPSSHLKRR